MKTINNIYKATIGAVIILMITVSCSDENPYLEYTDKSSIEYTGIAEPISYLIGIEKVNIFVKLTSDPSVNLLKIIWLELGEEKMKNVEIEKEDFGQVKEILIDNIPQGTYNFVFTTHNEEQGLYSVKTSITAEVFGQSFIDRLIPLTATATSGGSENVALTWSERVDSGLVGKAVRYTNNSDEEIVLDISKEERETQIEDHQFGTPIRYYTKYYAQTWLDTISTKEKRAVLTHTYKDKSAWVAKGDDPVYDDPDYLNGRIPQKVFNGAWSDAGDMFVMTDAHDYPHVLDMDFGSLIDVGALTFMQRQDNLNWNLVKLVQIEVSEDNANWIDLGETTIPKSFNVYAFNFDQKRKIRFVRMTFKSDHSDGTRGTIAEIGAYVIYD